MPDNILSNFAGLSVEGVQAVVIDPDNIEPNLTQQSHFTQLNTTLANQDYQALVGDTLTFDAGRTIAYNTSVTKYEWDFDDDGQYDLETSTPIIRYIYQQPYEGSMSIRATTQDGLEDTASASVLVYTEPPPASRIKQPANLQGTWTSDTTARFTWEPADNLATRWAISIDGLIGGWVEKDQHFINISDLSPDETMEFGVQAIAENGEISERTTMTLQKKGQDPLQQSAARPDDLETERSSASVSPLASDSSDKQEDHQTSPAVSEDEDSSPLLDEQQNRPPLILYILSGVAVTSIGAAISWKLYTHFKRAK